LEITVDNLAKYFGVERTINDKGDQAVGGALGQNLCDAQRDKKYIRDSVKLTQPI
jgi:hypothetical protein